MRYAFNLEWNELPKKFREKKVRQYISDGEKRQCEECDGERIYCKKCRGLGQVDPDPDNLYEQEEAEEDIRAHFPIYF